MQSLALPKITSGGVSGCLINGVEELSPRSRTHWALDSDVPAPTAVRLRPRGSSYILRPIRSHHRSSLRRVGRGKGSLSSAHPITSHSAGPAANLA